MIIMATLLTGCVLPAWPSKRPEPVTRHVPRNDDEMLDALMYDASSYSEPPEGWEAARARFLRGNVR